MSKKIETTRTETNGITRITITDENATYSTEIYNAGTRWDISPSFIQEPGAVSGRQASYPASYDLDTDFEALVEAATTRLKKTRTNDRRNRQNRQ